MNQFWKSRKYLQEGHQNDDKVLNSMVSSLHFFTIVFRKHYRFSCLQMGTTHFFWVKLLTWAQFTIAIWVESSYREIYAFIFQYGATKTSYFSSTFSHKMCYFLYIVYFKILCPWGAFVPLILIFLLKYVCNEEKRWLTMFMVTSKLFQATNTYLLVEIKNYFF